jgi:hypothetical protein
LLGSAAISKHVFLDKYSAEHAHASVGMAPGCFLTRDAQYRDGNGMTPVYSFFGLIAMQFFGQNGHGVQRRPRNKKGGRNVGRPKIARVSTKPDYQSGICTGMPSAILPA